MINKTAIASFEVPRNYWSLKYPDEEKMITDRQRHTLNELICANFQGDERELRLSQIEDMTSVEATDAIYEISTGKGYH